MVCTGNICRSPMAAALLRAHLESVGAPARVRSAGTLAWEAPVTLDAAEVMREMGLDIGGHRSTPLGTALIEDADLILGMTRDHIGRIVSLVPEAADRAFLIGELLRLADTVGPRRGGEDFASWLRRLAAARPDDYVLGRSRDEIADPLGEPIERYRSTAARLDRELRALAELLALEWDGT